MGTTHEVIPDPKHLKFSKGDLFACLLIGLMPFALLVVNDNWIFVLLKYTDTWIYTGFHLHLKEYLQTFGYTYYASRMPWTVAGWLLHRSFDDAQAVYILHFCVFYSAIFSFYTAVRTIFANAPAACAGSLLLGTHSHFLHAVGWDYVDGPALACSLAGIAALASTAFQRRWRFAALIWGAVMCAMVSLYILLIAIVPVQIGLFLLLNRLRARRSILVTTAWFTVGCAAAMLCMGLINWYLGGPFFYPIGQVKILSTMSAYRYTENLPVAQWIGEAPWLLLPAISFCFSCAYVCLRAKSVSKKIHLNDKSTDPELLLFVCCVANITASIIYIAMEADHFNVLHFPEYAVALLPFAYLTIGGALATLVGPLGKLQQILFLSVILVITLAPWEFARFGYNFPSRDLGYDVGWVLAGSLLLLFVVLRPYGLGGAITAVLFLSVVNIETTNMRLTPDPAVKPKMLAVFDASRTINRYNPYARARFWFNEEDPEGDVLHAIVASYLWEYSLVNEQFPKLTRPNGEQSSLVPGERIILLTSTAENPIALANAVVADQNLSLEPVANIQIRRPGIAPFAIFVTDTKIDSSKYREIPSSQVASVELPLKVVTEAHPWSYATQLPLLIQDLKGPLWIRIQAEVHGGPIGIGILNHDRSDFLTRTSVAFGDATVYLRVPEPRESTDLVIQSWQEGPAQVRVDAITVLEPWLDDPIGKTPAVSSSDAAGRPDP